MDWGGNIIVSNSMEWTIDNSGSAGSSDVAFSARPEGALIIVAGVIGIAGGSNANPLEGTNAASRGWTNIGSYQQNRSGIFNVSMGGVVWAKYTTSSEPSTRFIRDAGDQSIAYIVTIPPAPVNIQSGTWQASIGGTPSSVTFTPDTPSLVIGVLNRSGQTAKNFAQFSPVTPVETADWGRSDGYVRLAVGISMEAPQTQTIRMTGASSDISAVFGGYIGLA